jgi:hypothetical protein
MGYRGKLAEQMRARELRAQSWTLQAIADELGVSKSSVSLWVRDVEFVPKPRNRGHPKQTAHPMKLRKQAELDQCRIDADEWARDVTERERFVYGLALYAGEGFKTDGTLGMANTSPIVLRFFVDWLRRFFDVDETRLRVRCTCTTVSTWTPPIASGPTRWTSLSTSSPCRTERCSGARSAGPNT